MKSRAQNSHPNTVNCRSEIPKEITLIDFFSNTYVQTIILSLVSAAIATFFVSRPRLVWSKTHQNSFRLKSEKDERPLYINTSEIWVKNLGRSQARQVEVVLNFRPQHYQVWTPRKCKEEVLADDRLSLTFDTLGPNDELEISMLDSFADTPNVLEVRHEAGLANEEKMQTNIQPGRFTIVALSMVFLMGLILIFYQIAAFIGPMLFSGP